jgi:chromosome segregation ATPase
MSKPLNLQEHNSAFARFLIFFFVTVAMVASALYFDFQVPKKELQLLRERSDLLRNQYIAQEKYKRLMAETITTLNRLDSPNANKAMVQSAFKPKIDALISNVSLDDSTATQRLHKEISDLMNLYADARFKLAESKNCIDELDLTKKKYSSVKEELDNLRANMNLDANRRQAQPQQQPTQ